MPRRNRDDGSRAKPTKWGQLNALHDYLLEKDKKLSEEAAKEVIENAPKSPSYDREGPD